jgi:diguanylate cyclase (GGDEF)-like protein
MKNWISFQAELGNFQHRNTIYIFALKMSFLAVIFSAVVIILTLPPLGYFGILPINLVHAIIFGVILSWLIGGVVSGVLSLIAGYALHQLTLSRAEFEQLSRTDMLSGLLNRRAFAEALERIDGDASLVIFDVDRFKAINDRFGHACGDEVIVAVSALLASTFDGGSVVARLGGEEFGVIVTGEVLEERLERVDSVRAKLAECPLLADSCQVAITVSAGIADLGSGRNSEAAYASADKALYLAKALGRNRVIHERDGLHHAWHGLLVENGLGVQGAAPDYDGPHQAYGI